MEIPAGGKSSNTSLSFRYTANNEALEQLCDATDVEPQVPACDISTTILDENASPKRSEKTSIIDKYFKSIRSDKEREEVKAPEEKPFPSSTKEVISSPVKEYLTRLGKKSVSEVPTEIKEGSNETWKIFHDFKFKIAQAVEDMKTKSTDESKDKLTRDNSMSDSEENSALKDLDQQSVGDTDNQVSSLESSMHNLSEITQPVTATVNDREVSFLINLKNDSQSSDNTHKNLVRSESLNGSRNLLSDNLMDVESGVEALEDNCVDYNSITDILTGHEPNQQSNSNFTPPPVYGCSPNNEKLLPCNKTEATNKNHFCNFSMYFLTIFLLFNYCLFPNWNVWNGFLLGLWCYCFVGNVKEWFLDTYLTDDPHKRSFHQLKKSSNIPAVYTIPPVKEYRPPNKFEGWINHYRFPEYNPLTYHINQTTTAFVKLEGCNLRISYTKTKIAKRAFWDEKIENIIFYQHRLYNLKGARVVLLPNGLVKRRFWSKKYPICIILSDKEKIQVLEKENMPIDKKEMSPDKKSKDRLHEESTETSPEKKKKFVWRRREKSISRSEASESSKEGLRHRFVRKMHRDKKSDSSSMSTEPEQEKLDLTNEQPTQEGNPDALKSIKYENDEESDENELNNIKLLLDEAEMENNGATIEGEWSVHVKESKDKHAQLFFFTRTGRDKHEWYSRLTSAIREADASVESSAAEDKSSSDPQEVKDDIEMATYNTNEKEGVTFSRYAKSFDGPSDVIVTKTRERLQAEWESYEKTFWPYLFKILKTKTPSPTCECRLLPQEVMWVNTLLARVMYDVTRNPKLSARLQNRVQRKLNTLKLPSFMSPLLVTELSLQGACPLIERVGGTTYDERGIWLDADIRYDGGALITVLTQINLMKLKDKNITLEEQLLESEFMVNLDVNTSSTALSDKQREQTPRKKKLAVFDSDAEDSAESSSDDGMPPVQPVDSAEDMVNTDGSVTAVPKGSPKTKFLKMVDKIATNKYFQQVTDYKYVKRAMEGLSNTDIKLQLVVHGLEGRLAINLPPPPHDRVWLGFRTNPQLVLKARPAVGARTLRFAQISNWIEEKLGKEFERVLVLPNMEDIIVDLMTPTPVQFE